MPQELKSSRREQMTNLRETGLTYAEIGRKLGLSRERVRQIIMGISTPKKSPTPDDPNALLTTAQAAALLNVHLNTIRRWSNKGILATYRVGPRSDRRFRQRDIDNFLLKESAASTS